MTFKTKKEACAYLEELGFTRLSDGKFYKEGRYDLSHGEYAQPEFMPVYYKALGGWAIKKIHYYYPGTFYAPKDGPAFA